MKKYFSLLLLLFLMSCNLTPAEKAQREFNNLSEEGKRLFGEHKIPSLGREDVSGNIVENKSDNVNCKIFYKNLGGNTTFMWENVRNKQITWLTIETSKIRFVISDSVDYPTVKFRWTNQNNQKYPINLLYIVWKSPRKYAPIQNI